MRKAPAKERGIGRRPFAGALLLALAGPFAAPVAQAEAKYPSQPIRVIVPFGVGGLADISIRLVAQKLSQAVGQQVVIENKPGAGGVVAANSVLSSPHDGYTLTLFANGTAISKTLFKLPYDLEKDFAPISTVAYFDLILLTNAKGRLGSVPALLAEGRKRQLVLGSINPGSTQNLSAELFKSMAHLDAMVVPFKSTPEVLTALLRGDVDVMFESYTALKGAIDSKQAIPIASTATQRSPWLAKVPTVKESGVAGYDVAGWNALYAPAGVPADRLAYLNTELNKVLREPDVIKRLQELGSEARGSTQQEMASIMKRDMDKWAAVIKDAGIQVQQ